MSHVIIDVEDVHKSICAKISPLSSPGVLEITPVGYKISPYSSPGVLKTTPVTPSPSSSSTGGLFITPVTPSPSRNLSKFDARGWAGLLKLVNLVTVCFLLLCISYEDQSHGGPLSMLVLR